MPRPCAWRVLASGLVLLPLPLSAQHSVALRSLGSIAEDRARIAALTDPLATAPTLLRVGGEVDAQPLGWRLVRPELRVTHQSQLPAPDNDGALWSGRGRNALLRGGATVGWRRLRVTLAPEVVHSANRPFEVRPSRVEGWQPFASPWRTADAPADVPVRPGDQPLTVLLPGQSSATVQLASVSIGITSGNLWWGPGIRNALVLSDHAPGIPRVTIRSPQPHATLIGVVTGEWFLGGLTESLTFDTVAGNDLRSVSGVAATLTPRGLPGLTLGVGRLVLAEVRRAGALAAHAADAVAVWGETGDQMTTSFARWIAPHGGVEVWAEYARQRLPVTLREALTQPNADMGWTAGAQWALPRTDGVLRLQGEVSDVAQSLVDPVRPPRDWGSGRQVVQGFTQRGQLLGPATGPGSTHGWLAVDRLREAWGLGAFAARTRWENDAYYREGILSFFGHDVSLLAGVRGHRRQRGHDLGASVTWERRFNYQFENGTVTPNKRGQRTYDNLRLTLTVTAR